MRSAVSTFAIVLFVVSLASVTATCTQRAGQMRLPVPTKKKSPKTHEPAKPRQEPCWKQVGISQAVVNQRRSITENTRAEVQAVCADSSLSDQQKRTKIREIHQSAKER